MRTHIDIDSDDIFRRRAEEKDRMRDELFSEENRRSDLAKEHARKLGLENPKRIRVGKPAFAPKF